MVVNVSGMVTKLAGTPRASARGGMQGASFVMKAWAARNAMQLVRDSAACFGRRHLVNFALDAIDKAKFPKRRATCGPPMPEIWHFDPSRYNGEGRNDHNTPPAFSGGMLTECLIPPIYMDSKSLLVYPAAWRRWKALRESKDTYRRISGRVIICRFRIFWPFHSGNYGRFFWAIMSLGSI